MGKALYRKYRPKRLADIVGQEAIIATLTRALQTGAISHAYLLTGPRGVGKTSIARILAHEINSLPYTDDSIHMDIIEIDAASNRRIDEIRDLRDKIHIAPTSAKYKVYIIDEVHMLTREAFNALLKTLEEPPQHAVFILATTEAHKVPDTIQSRTQRFTFKPYTKEEVVGHLEFIAKQENMHITKDALELIATHAKGSFRDSINLLDQLASAASEVALEDVQLALGVASDKLITNIQNALKTKDASSIISAIDDARIQGTHAAEISQQLMAQLREGLKVTQNEVSIDTIELLEGLAAVQSHSSPFIALELALLKAISSSSHTNAALMVETPKKPIIDAQPTQIQSDEAATKKVQHVTTKSVKAQPVANVTESVIPSATITANSEIWPSVLEGMKGRYNTLYSTLRMAQATLQNDELILGFQFPFHQKQISQVQNIEKISQEIIKVTGTPLKITCVVIAATKPTDTEPTPPTATLKTPSALTDVSNIFDGAELLE